MFLSYLKDTKSEYRSPNIPKSKHSRFPFRSPGASRGGGGGGGAAPGAGATLCKNNLNCRIKKDKDNQFC